jgi:FKBP-type peptidyl-prolyl cis-trans isomerase SlpA
MTAVITSTSYLTLHYRLTTLAGEEILSTYGLSPATLQMGSQQLADNLEACLLGLKEGEHRVFELPAAAAFGEANPALMEHIALSALPPTLDTRENSLVEFTTPEGHDFSGFLREKSATHARFDFNHPLAGKSLRFEVDIVAIL